MDKEASTTLLNGMFNKTFDLTQFTNFIKELFNNFQVEKRDCTGYIANQYAEYISSLIKIGEYEDNSKRTIEVLVVKLNKTASRDRARTMQRNFIANWLGKTGKNAALVAFYGDDPEDWRFSFVKMDYQLKVEDGKPKIIEELTPAKRYSFLVGKNEPNHTAQKQLYPLLLEEDTNPTLEDIEKAFGIENVTKEFFNKYKELYWELKESLEKVIEKDSRVKKEFEDKCISSIDFSKKLLGQIVFLYFLQKKGWLGVSKDESGRFKEWGTGPKDFMRKLFSGDPIKYENFFNDVLEPLFYNALANDRTADDDYHPHFKCKIPFLNGGLFEPINDYNWRETDIILDNQVFFNILKVFDEFNFTVKEDEPLEKEVAIDPEMLGKVFENLLEVKDRKSKGSFYTPREIVHYMCQQSLINYLETNTGLPREDIEKFIRLGDFALDIIIKEQEQIKKYGRTYKIKEETTLPRSIKENYIKIDQLLRDIKVVDPAVGSGAFPVGIMNEIVKARSILTVFFDEQAERTNYNLKRETIENSLYGVDIDSSAVDIAKLRFWLSLIVDELDMKNIKPLPNLDHKIMCGNSLLEEFEGVKLFDDSLLVETKSDNSLQVDQIENEINKLHQELGLIYKGQKKGDKKQIEKEIKKLNKEKQQLISGPKEEVKQSTFYDAITKRVKESKRKLKELKELQKEFFNEQNRKRKKELSEEIDRLEWGFIEETMKEQGNEEALKKLEQYKKNKSKPFFLWKLYFSEIFQRDNPGFDVVIANPPYVGEKGHKEIFQEIKNGFLGKFHQGKTDLFYFFFHLALEISRLDASIAFITTNYYPTATGGNKLRSDLKNRAVIKNLINFNELKIFDSALGQHNMITIFCKGSGENILANNCITSRKGIANYEILNKILSSEDQETFYYVVRQSDLYENDVMYIRLSGTNSKNYPINQIFKKIQIQSFRLDEVCDVKVGLRTGIDKVSNNHLEIEKEHKLGESVFVLEKDEYIKIPKGETNIVKPLFKNSDIYKWKNELNSKFYVIYSKTNTDIKKYPFLKNHLVKFKSLIEEIRKNDGEVWYSIVRPREERIFIEPKIVAPQRSRNNVFSYNEIEFYGSSDVYYIVRKDGIKDVELKYIIALLNSKLYYLWLYIKGKRKGEILELYQQPLSEIPIKKISLEQQAPFIYLVDRILSITKDNDYLDNPNKQAEVKKLETEIDQLVYKLYSLSSEEITIIEEFNKKICQT